MNAPARRFGPELLPGGGVVFNLWAPSVAQAAVVLDDVDANAGRADRNVRMKRDADGWHSAIVAEARAGTRYRFSIGDLDVPDPASRYNPDDVHGASAVTDPRSYRWQDEAWRGRPWVEAVIYELHVGAFTPQGTYRAAMERLAELADLGVTAIELMPLADFPGARNWGYDGVLHYAPDATYGHPDDLKALVDCAHALGLMVLLDVVYNHFGPDGNYLHVYCPEFFNPDHYTPWGAGINFDGDHHAAVRQFYRDNALYWIEEFHFDGLRMDAIDRISDRSPRHIVEEIAAALHEGPGRLRPIHIVLENGDSEAWRLARGQQGEPLGASAQWNDDFHHAAHVLLTGETDGYYEDFADRPTHRLARALAHGFDYQGEYSAHRQRLQGSNSAHLPSNAFVSFVQNHDQIGNHALGERMDTRADVARIAAMYACLLLSPHIPMMFMGEEFAASSPFLFFCDFHGELGRRVAAGRRHEFARFAAFADEAAQQMIPDPNELQTFERSKLRWDELAVSPHRDRLAHLRELLALRHAHLVPRLSGQATGGSYRSDGDLIQVEWLLGDGTPWHLFANFGAATCTLGSLPSGRIVYDRGSHESSDGRTALGAAGVLVIALERR